MKDVVWFLVQILVLETSLILIRTCWVLKHFRQRKGLNTSSGKHPSCLPHERIKDDNPSRVWWLCSLGHITLLHLLHGFLVFVFTMQQSVMQWMSTRSWPYEDLHPIARQEDKSIFFPFEISLRQITPCFLSPLSWCVVPVWTWTPNACYRSSSWG